MITVHVWRTLPFADRDSAGRMTSIPQDLNDAAEIDGAGFWRQLFYIRLPLLLPIMVVALLYGIVFTFTDIIVVYRDDRWRSGQRHPGFAELRLLQGRRWGSLAQGAAIALFLLPGAGGRRDPDAATGPPGGDGIDGNHATPPIPAREREPSRSCAGRSGDMACSTRSRLSSCSSRGSLSRG